MADSPSFAQKAYEAIKNDIITQKVKPGSFISEAEYADRIGISRTPVREALKTLEKEGLLDIYPRKGVQIKSFTIDDIMQIHEASEALESILMAMVAERYGRGRIDPAEFAKLQDLLEQMDAHLKSGNLQKWLSCDHKFHSGLIGLCDNPYIAQYATTSRNRLNLTLWFITPKYADKHQSTQDHHAILAAIEAGDPAAAMDAAKSHIARVRKNMAMAMGVE